VIAAISARAGVVICVAIAAYIGAARLDDTIAVFDFRADLNAGLTYRERTYLDSGIAGSWRVMEDGRLWMPEDATYRVVRGSPTVPADLVRHARYFLRGRLAPRRQTNSESARWVFCFGCGGSKLGSRLRVLSASGDGFVFGRLEP